MTAGLVATTAMTASYGVERRLRHSSGDPLDYDDDSTVPTHAAMLVLGIDQLGPVGQRRLFLLVHWGYGSVMGVLRDLAGSRLHPRTATTVYWAGLMVMVGTLFPVLGRTPPPWRWRGDTLATSAIQHAVYATVAGLVSDGLRP